MKLKSVGVIAATAAAGLFAAGTSLAGPKVVKGHFCLNNTCKGHSACGGAGNKNGCGGKNECKGKGWLDAKDAKSCKAKGGKWKSAKMLKKAKKAAGGGSGSK